MDIVGERMRSKEERKDEASHMYVVSSYPIIRLTHNVCQLIYILRMILSYFLQDKDVRLQL